jgi:hypothetical protein
MRVSRVGNGVDLISFTWVDQYLKGLEFDKQIEDLKGEIEAIRREPLGKSDILEALQALPGMVKTVRIQTVRTVLQSFQNGEIQQLTPHSFAQVWAGPGPSIISPSHTGAHGFEALLDEKIIAAALELLPEGLTRAEKQSRISALEAKIKKLKEQRDKECWPPERYVYDDLGRPMPGSDRWGRVVSEWRKVAAPYKIPVDLEGYGLDPGDPADQAFKQLRLSKCQVGQALPRQRPV